jgi:hypothetical protein
MQGKMILPSVPEEGSTKGMLDPSTLEQSGAAPGAMIFPPEEHKAGEQS